MARSAYLIIALLTACAVHGADGWAQLKGGMSRADAIAVLGVPLVESRGREFAVAIYDERAEVIFVDDRVIDWTAPGAKPGVNTHAANWHFGRTRRDRPLFAAQGQGNTPPAPAARTGAALPAYRL
jgi:hypothetical protein